MELSVLIAAYAAMFGGTMGGQFLGMVVDALAQGKRHIWVPLACSVLLEAILGERLATARLGRRLLGRERLRLSVSYSAGLALVTLPLIGWLAISHLAPGQAIAAQSSHDIVVAIAIVSGGLLLYTALRTGLMTLFARRS